MTTGEDPSTWGARLARLGHSASIMTCAPLIESRACASRPSGPGRRFNSEARNVALQNSTSESASRQTSMAITEEIPDGRDLFLVIFALISPTRIRAIPPLRDSLHRLVRVRRVTYHKCSQ